MVGEPRQATNPGKRDFRYSFYGKGNWACRRLAPRTARFFSSHGTRSGVSSRPPPARLPEGTKRGIDQCTTWCCATRNPDLIFSFQGCALWLRSLPSELPIQNEAYSARKRRIARGAAQFLGTPLKTPSHSTKTVVRRRREPEKDTLLTATAVATATAGEADILGRARVDCIERRGVSGRGKKTLERTPLDRALWQPDIIMLDDPARRTHEIAVDRLSFFWRFRQRLQINR